MSNVLGVLLFLVFIAAIIGAAASITWLVVKLSPPKGSQSPPAS
ncbi:MAG: hypothetical protein ACRDL2_00495 [Gaiellaceae bacterium]